jgi:hypothetical protein
VSAKARLDGGWLALLAEVLAGLPKLPGALCVGIDPRTFDCIDGKDIGRAVAICEGCPALSLCRTWSAQRRGLSGVWAGKYRGSIKADDGQNQRGTA